MKMVMKQETTKFYNPDVHILEAGLQKIMFGEDAMTIVIVILPRKLMKQLL